MKVEKVEDTGFKPVVIQITITSEEELETLKDMTGYNVSIPKVLDDNFGPVFYRVQEFLSALGMALVA